MPIYTKTGDKGTTAVFGGKRLLKSDIQIETYGNIDEVTSFIGLTMASLNDIPEKKLLTNIQISLYQIMSVLAGASTEIKSGRPLLENLGEETLAIEKVIDLETGNLPPLNRFVLPQGSELSSLYHVCRSVVRRAERSAVALMTVKKELANDKQMLIMIAYLNRLSDLFFTLARKHVRGQEIVT